MVKGGRGRGRSNKASRTGKNKAKQSKAQVPYTTSRTLLHLFDVNSGMTYRCRSVNCNVGKEQCRTAIGNSPITWGKNLGSQHQMKRRRGKTKRKEHHTEYAVHAHKTDTIIPSSFSSVFCCLPASTNFGCALQAEIWHLKGWFLMGQTIAMQHTPSSGATSTTSPGGAIPQYHLILFFTSLPYWF